MSWHILHVLKHGALLAKEHGFIIFRGRDGTELRRPHDDIRAVVIAARGVTLTSNFVSSVLETNGVILYCNELYRPCGVTVPLQRVVDQRAFLGQIARPKHLNERLWHRMLRGKTLNQQRVLERRHIHSPHLEHALKSNSIDEGNCARRYWRLFFPSIGWAAGKRGHNENTPLQPDAKLRLRSARHIVSPQPTWCDPNTS